MSCLVKKNFIKNSDLPVCKNCINYIRDINNDYHYGKCQLFGEKNIFSGSIRHTVVETARSDEDKCGKEGKYYFDYNENKTANG
jgi:hypothetical protein